MFVAGRFCRGFVMAVRAISRTGLCSSVLTEAQYMEGGGGELSCESLR